MQHTLINPTTHIPDDLAYGPVRSRRFGRSLGISLTPAGTVTCAWRCPYCQLGHGKPGPFPSANAVIMAAEQALKVHAGKLDCICICGSGEPTDHPDFARITEHIGAHAADYGLPSILLTNGDGLHDADKMRAAISVDECYIKYDPGPRKGAWSAPSHRERILMDIPELMIQAMVFAGPGEHGNNSAESREAWIAQLEELDPVVIHLMTIERAPRDDRLHPVSRQELNQWRRACRLHGLHALVF